MAPIDLGNIAIKVILIVLVLFGALKFGGSMNSGAATAEMAELIEKTTGKPPKELFTAKSIMYLFIGLMIFGVIISIINFFKPL